MQLDIISNEDYHSLMNARYILENPGFAEKINSLIGRPVEAGIQTLPDSIKQKINKIAKTSTLKALKYAVKTMGNAPKNHPRNFEHKIAAAISGAAGGFFGLSSIAVELPVSTMIILRSIADIARSEGEDLKNVDTKLECLEVFALGEKPQGKKQKGIGYYGIRAVLANEISRAAEHISAKGLSSGTSPVILKFINIIAERFGIVISQKIAVSMIPLVGALSGGMINILFIEHFQKIAKAHFTIRRLEKTYGEKHIRKIFLQNKL